MPARRVESLPHWAPGSVIKEPTLAASSRRQFIIHVAAGGTVMACAPASAVPRKIEETEPKAASLGYKHDSSKVDAVRFPKHTPAEKCHNCMAWLGGPTDPWAECDLTADRLVSNTGWCSSYVKAGKG